MSQAKESANYLSGENFTKNDLKKRLRKMNVDFNEVIPTKNYFVELYDNSLKIEKNRKRIEKELQKDKDILSQRGKNKREKTKIKNIHSSNSKEKSINLKTIRKITVIKIRRNKKVNSNNKSESKEKEEKIIDCCYKIHPSSEKIMLSSEKPRKEDKEHSEKKQQQKLYISPVKQTRFSMDNIALRDKEVSPFFTKNFFEVLLNHNSKEFPNQVKSTQNSDSINRGRMPITPPSKGNKGTIINGGMNIIHLSPSLPEKELKKIHNCLCSPFILLSSGFFLCAFGLGYYYISKLSFYRSFSSLFEKVEFTSVKDIFISSLASLKENLFSFLSNILKGNNPYSFFILIILLIVGYFLYKNYKEKKIAKNVYVKVKKELKKINEIRFTNIEFKGNPENGLSENEIVRKYSTENGMNEKNFECKVLPIMKKLRKKDVHIKE